MSRRNVRREMSVYPIQNYITIASSLKWFPPIAHIGGICLIPMAPIAPASHAHASSFKHRLIDMCRGVGLQYAIVQ